jgi:hypothetical protein
MNANKRRRLTKKRVAAMLSSYWAGKMTFERLLKQMRLNRGRYPIRQYYDRVFDAQDELVSIVGNKYKIDMSEM